MTGSDGNDQAAQRASAGFETEEMEILGLATSCVLAGSDVEKLLDEMFTFRSTSSVPDVDLSALYCCDDGDKHDATNRGECFSSGCELHSSDDDSITVDDLGQPGEDAAAYGEADESATRVDEPPALAVKDEVLSFCQLDTAESTPEGESSRSDGLPAVPILPSLTRAETCSDLGRLHVRSADSPCLSSTALCLSKSAMDLRTATFSSPRVFTFDVRGRRFQCGENLIAKFPHKRLHQVTTRRCNITDSLTETFFINCNARHFEAILDWYRSGNLVRPRSVDGEAFEADVIYFDLRDELVPPDDPRRTSERATSAMSIRDTKSPSTSSSRRHACLVKSGTPPLDMSTFATSLPELDLTSCAASSRSVLPQQSDKGDEGLEPSSRTDQVPLRFFRRERRVLRVNSIPVVYTIRENEKLLVESVKGRGRLMVRVCDATGMQIVHVSEAVLYDSRSRFYLDGGRAQLQHNALLPGSYTYTFWMDESTTNQIGAKEARHEALDIEFKLLFTFQLCEKLEDSEDIGQRLTQLPGDDDHEPNPEKTPPVQRRTKTFSPTLFFPPSQLERHLGYQPFWTHTSGKSSTNGSSPPPKLQLSPLSKLSQQHAGSSTIHQPSPSPIRCAGATIARSQLPVARHTAGKITIYRPDKLDMLPVKCEGAKAVGVGQGWPAVSVPVRNFTHPTVEDSCRHLQPRVFR